MCWVVLCCVVLRPLPNRSIRVNHFSCYDSVFSSVLILYNLLNSIQFINPYFIIWNIYSSIFVSYVNENRPFWFDHHFHLFQLFGQSIDIYSLWPSVINKMKSCSWLMEEHENIWNNWKQLLYWTNIIRQHYSLFPIFNISIIL